MNKTRLNNLIKEQNIVIPLYLYKNYKKFDLTLEEFVFIMYLSSSNNMIFDPTKISEDLNIEIDEVMNLVSNLCQKDIMNLDVDKDNGVLEEKINLDNFYEKVSLTLMEELNTREPGDENIYILIEKEFNRELTPLEKEKIMEWQNEYSDELIKEAVKSSSINGVNNLRYIDKILYDWERRGIKTKKDIDLSREPIKEEIPVYNTRNWFDDDEDEI